MGYKYSIAQLQDYYYTTWSNKFKFDQTEAERKHRYVKRSAALKEKKMKKVIALRQSQRLQSAQNSSNHSNAALSDSNNGPGIEDDVIEDDEDVTLSNAPENIDESEHGDQIVHNDAGDIDEEDDTYEEEENGMEAMCLEEDDSSYSDDQSVEDELNCEPNSDDDGSAK